MDLTKYRYPSLLATIAATASDSAPRIAFVGGPEILAITEAQASLVRRVEATTNLPIRLGVALSDGQGDTLRLEFDELSHAHEAYRATASQPAR